MVVSSTTPAPTQAIDNNIGVMFVRSDLDEYGLDPYEFRVYGHITRRTGGRVKGTAFSSVKKMAKGCGMSTRKLQYALKVLCHAGLLRKEKHSEYRTNVYMLNPPQAWAAKENLIEIRKSARDADANDSSIGKKTESHEKGEASELQKTKVSVGEDIVDGIAF